MISLSMSIFKVTEEKVQHRQREKTLTCKCFQMLMLLAVAFSEDVPLLIRLALKALQ